MLESQSLRSRLIALGVAPDLALFDDRYFYAGADFLLAMSLTIPALLGISIGLAILLSTIAAFLYVPYWILPQRIKGTVRGWVGNPWRARWEWWGAAYTLTLTGIVLAVAIIQVLMRQVVVFSDLLLASYLPGPKWLQILLLDPDSDFRWLYFAGLVAGVAVTGALFVVVRGQMEHTAVARLLTGIFAFLVAVQLVLLPVNHGILISAVGAVPRVMSLDGEKELENGHEAWRIWEGKEWVAYFVRRIEKDGEQRKLISLRRDDVKKIEIIAYDPLHILFPKAR